MIEIEEKYLVDIIDKNRTWEKEFIIYQWYIEILPERSTKLKLIFNLVELTWRYVKIEKYILKNGISEKKVTYLNREELNVDNLKRYPFVMKRRSIDKNFFLDRFIRSNGICEYLLEIEYENETKIMPENKHFHIIKNVTDDRRYLNQNMAVVFDEKSQIELNILLQIFA